MEYTSFKQSNLVVYQLSGSLIGENHGISIVESINQAISEGEKRFVMDLAELQHINSTGLGVLITLLTKARKVGGDLVLANPSKFIQSLLLVTKLNSIFKVFESADDAANNFPEN
ncbi:MAG: STAS domain-containing protein [Bacteroidia bacterium]